jgi:hypothetical protein
MGGFCGCFGLLLNYWGLYMVVQSCDDKNKFLFVCVVIASLIDEIIISDVIASG